MVLELPEDEEEISVTSAAALSNKLLQLGNGAIYDEDRNIHEVHNCKIEAFMELIESLQGKPGTSVLQFPSMTGSGCWRRSRKQSACPGS